MLPLLYSSTTATSDILSNNGLGFIKNCEKCTVTKEMSGAYEAKLQVLTSDRLAPQIASGMLLKLPPSPNGTPQIFETYEVQQANRRLDISAQHVRYRASGNVFSESYVPTNNMTPLEVWEDIQEFLVFSHDFTFFSTISSALKPTAAADSPVRLGDFLMGRSGSMLDTYGGYFDFDNYNINFKPLPTQKTGVCLRIGSGISELDYSETNEFMYTHIAGYASLPMTDDQGNILAMGNVVIDPVSTGNTILTYDKALSYDFTEEFQKAYPKFAMISYNRGSPSPESYAEAKSKLLTVIMRYAVANADTLRNPTVSINVTTQPEVEQLQSCEVADLIQIYYEPLELSAVSRIVKTTYDVLAERYTRVELGYSRPGLSKYISSVNAGGI